MKTTTRISFFLLGVLFLCSVGFWAINSPTVYDYSVIYERNKSETHLVRAFAIALRINHPVLYEMVDPKLKPRVDEWMALHQSKQCARRLDNFFVGKKVDGGYSVIFSCSGEETEVFLKIGDVVVEKMKIIDWSVVITSE